MMVWITKYWKVMYYDVVFNIIMSLENLLLVLMLLCDVFIYI